jgi:hypothetical protein
MLVLTPRQLGAMEVSTEARRYENMITVETRDKVEQYLKEQGITHFFVYIADTEDGHLLATSTNEYELATLLGNLIN